MTVLAPFDRHPADPATVAGYGEALAGQASQAVTQLWPGTRRAYAPVLTQWRGVGAAEAGQAAQQVGDQAQRLGTRVVAATVALACWSRCVREFNDEVSRIVARVAAAGIGAGDLTEAELAERRRQARREGELAWHAAYETHILAGRDQVRRVLADGPTDQLVLELFQAGLLPIAVIELFPRVDFGQLDWALLYANLRALGRDPAQWATAGSYDPQALLARLELLRELGVPPREYADLLQLYWVSLAAQKAGIDLAAWQPSRGAHALSDTIQAVYTYYGNLFLDHPYLQWAGMANMIGPSFAAGFFDLALFRRIAEALAGRPGVPVDLSVLADISDEELRFFETTFLTMQRNIFFDQAMMHEAYLAGGVEAIEELRRAGLIDAGTLRAWEQIDEGRRTGDQSLIERGNERLLQREQRDIIDEHYLRMYDRPVTGPAFTYLMTAVGEPSIPGAQSFADYRPLWVTIETPGPERIPFVNWDNPLQGEIHIRTPLPDGNLALYEDRWTFIQEDTLPAYQRLLREDPELARAIVGSDVAGRIDDFRLHHRIDSLLAHYLTDWGVRVNQ